MDASGIQGYNPGNLPTASTTVLSVCIRGWQRGYSLNACKHGIRALPEHHENLNTKYIRTVGNTEVSEYLVRIGIARMHIYNLALRRYLVFIPNSPCLVGESSLSCRSFVSCWCKSSVKLSILLVRVVHVLFVLVVRALLVRESSGSCYCRFSSSQRGRPRRSCCL